MLTRRQAVRLAALSGVAMALGGCDSTNESAKTAAQGVASVARTRKRRTLRVLHPDGSEGNLQPVVREFERLSGHSVELHKGTLEEIAAEVLLDYRLGRNAFDIAIPASYSLADLVEAGAIRPIDDFEKAHGSKDIVAGELYALGDFYKGKRYGYQADGDAIVMFYNRAWLEDPKEQERYLAAHGQPLAVPRTWVELDRQMTHFHAPTAGRYGGALFRHPLYVAWEYWLRLHALGVFPLSDSLEPRFTSDAGVEALEQMVRASALQEPGANNHTLFENFRSFGKGDKYANIGWGGTQKYLRSPDCPVRGNVSYGVMPGGTLGGEPTPLPYFNWGWTYVIAARARDPELAYLFSLFASTPTMSTLAVGEASGYFDPHRAEHYADEKVRTIYGEPFLKVHRRSMEQCIPDFYLQGRGRYFSTLQHAIASACRGRVEPKLAMAKLQEKWESLTNSMGRDDQREQWMALKASYPERLRKRLT